MTSNSSIAARCFQGLNDTFNRSSSDYLTQKKQKTLYKSLRSSIQEGNPTQQKKSGFAYNNTVGVQMCGPKRQAWNPYPGTPVLPSGKLATASSYEMLIDMAKGKHLVNPGYAGAESLKYGLWLSQLIAINYNGPQNTDTNASYRLGIGLNQAVPVQGLSIGSNTFGYQGLQADPSMKNMITFPLPPGEWSNKTVTNSFGEDASWNPMAAPGYILDPSENIIAYAAPGACIQPNGAKALGWWARLAIPTHQDQPGFWRAINAQPLNGIGTAGGFAKDITFSDDLADGNTGLRKGFIQQAFGPAISARTRGPYSCLPTNGSLTPGSVHGVQAQRWHRVGGGGAFSQLPPTGLDAQAHRVPGFMPRCARHQGCTSFDKLN